MIAEAPIELGAVQESATWPFPRVPATEVGAPGLESEESAEKLRLDATLEAYVLTSACISAVVNPPLLRGLLANVEIARTFFTPAPLV